MDQDDRQGLRGVLERLSEALNGQRPLSIASVLPELLAIMTEDQAATLLEPSLLLRAPATWLHGLESRLTQALAPDPESDAASRLAKLFERYNRDGKAITTLAAFLDPAGAAVLALGLDAHRALGASGGVIPLALPLTVVPAEAVSAGVIPASLADPTSTFEENAHAVTRMVKAVVEGWYKELVLGAVNLGRAARGRRALQSHKIGAIFGEARRLWPEGDLRRSILRPDAHLVRNAEAHGGVLVDVAGQTVGFRNVRDDGTIEMRGPFGRVEFYEMATALVRTITAMQGAYMILATDGFLDHAAERGFVSALIEVVFEPLLPGVGDWARQQVARGRTRGGST